jgi:hypothetical protein
VRLNSTAITYDDVLLYFYEGANEAIVAYFTTIKISRLDNSDVLTKFYITDLDLFQCGFVHGFLVIVNDRRDACPTGGEKAEQKYLVLKSPLIPLF